MEKGNTIGSSAFLIGFVAIFAGLAIGYSLGHSRISGPTHGKHMMADGSMMSDGQMGGVIDQRFIEEMIPHHQGAIDMAKIALERSKKPEILSLSKAIIAAQEKEIADMRSWYQAWYGSAVPERTMAGMHMSGMTGNPETLKTISATAFDAEFVQEMIPHHEMAVMMAQMLASGTERPEMKQLSTNVISSQSQEIEMMRGWLKSWSSK